MLVVTRKKGERIAIVDENGKVVAIVVVADSTKEGKIRIGIDAERETTIHREEIYELIYGRAPVVGEMAVGEPLASELASEQENGAGMFRSNGSYVLNDGETHCVCYGRTKVADAARIASLLNDDAILQRTPHPATALQPMTQNDEVLHGDLVGRHD